MMTDDDLSPDALGKLFASARAEEAPIGDDFLTRLQADAALAVAGRAREPVNLWRQIHALFGGWAGLGGLSVAGLAGFAFGISGSLGVSETLNAAAFLQNDLTLYSEQFSSLSLETLLLEDF